VKKNGSLSSDNVVDLNSGLNLLTTRLTTDEALRATSRARIAQNSTDSEQATVISCVLSQRTRSTLLLQCQ